MSHYKTTSNLADLVSELLGWFLDSAQQGPDVRSHIPEFNDVGPRGMAGGAPGQDEPVLVDVEVVRCKVRRADPPCKFRRLPGAPPLVIVDAELVDDGPQSRR